jgi:hypothetical protein
MQKFINPNDENGEKTRETLRRWVVERLKLTNVDSVVIQEHVCTDPGCLHAETVFKVENTEGVALYKIAKPLVYVRKWDIEGMQLVKML